MASFEISYQRVLGAEGGYQNNPNDSGNYNSAGELIGTNYGISAPVLEVWLGRIPSVWDMKLLELWEVKKIYRQRFWDPIRVEQLSAQPLADLLFDGRVNHGRTGTKLLQKVLGVPADGVIGPITLNAITARPPAQLYWQYKDAREQFYRYLADNRPGQAVFLNGWLNRLNKFQDYVRPSGSSTAGSEGQPLPWGWAVGAGILITAATAAAQRRTG